MNTDVLEIRSKVQQILSRLVQSDEYAAAFEGVFLVDVQASLPDTFQIFIDHLQGVKLSQCEIINRELVAILEKEDKDFSLEVSSYGLTAVFLMREHYLKNIGRTLEIWTNEGQKICAQLVALQDDDVAVLTLIEEPLKKSRTKKTTVVAEPIHLHIHTQICKAQLVLAF